MEECSVVFFKHHRHCDRTSVTNGTKPSEQLPAHFQSIKKKTLYKTIKLFLSCFPATDFQLDRLCKDQHEHPCPITPTARLKDVSKI